MKLLLLLLSTLALGQDQPAIRAKGPCHDELVGSCLINHVFREGEWNPDRFGTWDVGFWKRWCPNAVRPVCPMAWTCADKSSALEHSVDLKLYWCHKAQIAGMAVLLTNPMSQSAKKIELYHPPDCSTGDTGSTNGIPWKCEAQPAPREDRIIASAITAGPDRNDPSVVIHAEAFGAASRFEQMKQCQLAIEGTKWRCYLPEDETWVHRWDVQP